MFNPIDINPNWYILISLFHLFLLIVAGIILMTKRNKKEIQIKAFQFETFTSKQNLLNNRISFLLNDIELGSLKKKYIVIKNNSKQTINSEDFMVKPKFFLKNFINLLGIYISTSNDNITISTIKSDDNHEINIDINNFAPSTYILIEFLYEDCNFPQEMLGIFSIYVFGFRLYGKEAQFSFIDDRYQNYFSIRSDYTHVWVRSLFIIIGLLILSLLTVRYGFDIDLQSIIHLDAGWKFVFVFPPILTGLILFIKLYIINYWYELGWLKVKKWYNKGKIHTS